jgi:hypothetical protein
MMMMTMMITLKKGCIPIRDIRPRYPITSSWLCIENIYPKRIYPAKKS